MHKLVTVLVPILLGSSTALAATGQHGGQVVGNDKNKFEVRIDPNSSRIEVFSLRNDRKDPPRAMSITLYADPDTSQTIELKAAAPRVNDPPKFEGELGPNAGPIAGFELKFGINIKTLQALPYIPYIPPPAH